MSFTSNPAKKSAINCKYRRTSPDLKTHHVGLYLAMVTVYRAHGLRVVIFVDDHEPAHVHVFGDGEAKINLTGADDVPELLSAIGMTRADIRRAMRIMKEQQAFLLEQWSEIHG